MEENIRDFIKINNYESFETLGIKPKIQQKCIIALKSKEGKDGNYLRGLVESYEESYDSYNVRLLDSGKLGGQYLKYIYPYPESADQCFELSLKAIRCCLNRDRNIQFNSTAIELFNKIKGGSNKYELIEEVTTLGGIKCWYGDFINKSNESIAEVLMNSRMENKNENVIFSLF